MTPDEMQKQIAERKGWTRLYCTPGIPAWGCPPNSNKMQTVPDWPTDPGAADVLRLEMLENSDVLRVEMRCQKHITQVIVIRLKATNITVTNNELPAAICAAWLEVTKGDE